MNMFSLNRVMRAGEYELKAGGHRNKGVRAPRRLSAVTRTVLAEYIRPNV
jgi:hypothetical protein